MFQYFARPFIWYNDVLVKYPLVTKSITSGFMYAAGDVLAQHTETYTKNIGKDASKGDVLETTVLDKRRIVVFFLFGTFVSGPAMHYWFNYLNELPAALWQLKQMRHRGNILRAYAYLKSHGVEVKLDLSKLPNAVPLDKWKGKAAKIAADQLIFSPIYTFIFFAAIGMMEGGAHKLQHYLKSSSSNSPTDVKIAEVIQLIKKKTLEEDTDTLFFEHVKADLDEANQAQANQTQKAQKEKEQAKLVTDIIKLIQESKDKESVVKELKLKHHYEWDRIWWRTWSHTKEVYLTTYLTDIVVWPPLQLVNFSFVPLRFQFLFVNVCNLAWNTFLSIMANKKDDSHSHHSHHSHSSSKEETNPSPMTPNGS
jgi:hypothetical protein